jgi:hypothetical protein
MENKSQVKIIQHDLNAFNLQIIIRDISIYLLLQRMSHHLPINYWMKVNNNFFVNIPVADRAAAIDARNDANVLARITDYPATPAAGANAEQWKIYQAKTDMAEREIKVISIVIDSMRDAMPSNVKSNMDKLHITTVSTMINFWLQPDIYGTISNEQKLLEFEKLSLPINMPTSEKEKEQIIQDIDGKFTNFATSCFPDAPESVYEFLRSHSLNKCVKATAIESHPLQIAVSLLNATYSNEELATTFKNVIRNYPVNGDVKTHNGGANATKMAVSNHKDPNVQCYMHPDKPHLNKDCFQQKKMAKEIKEKKLKKSLAKAAKAKENAKAADSDTD